MTVDHGLLIGGAVLDAEEGCTFPDWNPATGDLVGNIPDAGPGDVARATTAARRAFDDGTWARDRGLRRDCLLQLHSALLDARESLRAELVAEVGTPVALTYSVQLDTPLDDLIPWMAKFMDDFPWERSEGVHQALGGLADHHVWKEPVGVVAAITPWNYPFEVELTKLVTALATGNTVVLKPAPDTPLHALRIGELIATKTDIPAGVVNIVTPSRTEVAQTLVTDPRVDLVSFTGSTAVGRYILRESANDFRRVFLELGGKSAHIVLNGADLASCIPLAAGVAAHAGQGCGMLTRLLVSSKDYAEAVAIANDAFNGIPVGDPTDPAVLCGPVINERQRDRIRRYISQGEEEGARVVVGGVEPPEGLERGWFIRPTLFSDVSNSMAIAREEIFGPVLVMIPYESEAEAVSIANDSPYGLVAAVTGPVDRAASVAHQLRAGAISINGAMYYGPHMPFGGYKASGIGRQNGREGFEQYLETKAVALPPE